MKNNIQIIILMIFLVGIHLNAQSIDAHYDESKVPEYKLPDLLTTSSGEKITDVKSWEKERRPEILQLFKDEVYGNIPKQKGIKIKSEVVERWQAFNNKATEASRGKRAYRWPIEMILNNGFGLATLYYGELDPDRDNFSDGLHPLFYQKNQKKPAENEWGSIGAWAWGASRVLDYLKNDPNQLTNLANSMPE
ncbi:MAG: hypothetical protein AAFO07_14555 [Bacteroidota bacterium]